MWKVSAGLVQYPSQPVSTADAPAYLAKGASMRTKRSARHLTILAGTMLLVSSSVATYALPAFATDLTEAAPIPDRAEQQFRVGADIKKQRLSIDDWGAAQSPLWVAPTTGELRDGFGPRLQRPVAGVSGMHRGQDLGAACGTPVRATSAGVVQQSGWFGTYGNWVLLDHGGGITTGYAHNATLLVSVGQTVRTGQVIAYAGTTGASTGCHVHLEVRQRTTAVDPRAFLSRRGVTLG